MSKSLPVLCCIPILLTSCSGPEKMSAPATEGLGLAPAGQTNTSPHFEAVSSQLDTGGIFFAYTDIDGDITKITDTLDETLRLTAASDTGALLQIPDDFSFAKLAEPLGLTHVAAFGMSSVDTGNGKTFRNKTFFYAPGGRKGLFSATGGAARPLRALEFAPAGSDLVYQLEFDLKPLNDIWKTWEASFQPTDDQKIKLLLEENLKEASLKFAEMLGKTKGQLIIVGKTAPDDALPIPLPGAEQLPGFDLLVCLEGMPWVFDEIHKKARKSDASPYQIEEDPAGIRIFSDTAGNNQSAYNPFLYFKKDSGQIFLATRQKILDECLGSGPKLIKDADYLTASTGLPTEGNGMAYVSTEFVKTAQDIIAFAVNTLSEGRVDNSPITPLLKLWLPGLYQSSASVTANRKDGILVTSNTATSHKRTALTFANPYGFVIASTAVGHALMTPSSLGSLLQMNALGMPGIPGLDLGALDTGSDPATNLTGLYEGIRAYAADNGGKYPEHLTDMEAEKHLPADVFVQMMMLGDTKVFYRRGLSTASPTDAIVLATAAPDEEGNRTVILNDGSVEVIPESVFQRETTKP